MCWCFLIKIIISKDILQCLFLVAFEIKAVVLQTFEEQLAILITYHISAQKSAHNHTLLYKLRVVNQSIDMQIFDISF